MAGQLIVDIPRKMGPFVAEKRRHKIARGGRGSAKSWSVARILVARGIRQRTRWLCCREVQKSIRESSHRLIADQIESLGLGRLYDIQRDVIKGPRGTEFVFAGLQDHTADSLKSYENFDGAWIEEAHTVSADSANILIPTIRNPGSELWWTYNPNLADDYIHQVAENPDEHTLVVDINWRDNLWFPAELELERLRMKALNEDLYQHIWEGKLRSIAGLLFKRNWFKFYDSLPARLSPYMASDYAGAPDLNSDREPDYTEHGIGQLDPIGDLYLTDWYSGQVDPEVWIDAAVQLVARRKPRKWFEEKGVILRSLDGAITKRLRERNVWVVREALASAGNKAERALGFAARCSAGAVWLPQNQPWAERLVNQLCSFTGEQGRVDDGVDVCSLLARGLDQMHNAREAVPKTKDDVVPFTRRHIEAQTIEDAEEAARKARYYS